MSRIVRPLHFMFALLLALSTTACFKHYQVITQSGPPSAVVGVPEVWVQYDSSHVGISDKRMSEEQWQATRDKPEHWQTYLETKDSANTGFVEGLGKGASGLKVNLGQAPAGAMQITVSYLEWEEGMYAAVVAWPSKAMARVIFSVDGATLDEIQVAAQENASLYTPAPQQRLHTVGQRLGQYTAEYLRDVGR